MGWIDNKTNPQFSMDPVLHSEYPSEAPQGKAAHTCFQISPHSYLGIFTQAINLQIQKAKSCSIFNMRKSKKRRIVGGGR